MVYYKDDCNISIPQTLLQCNQEIPHREVESNYCPPPWIWAGLSDSLTANRLWQKSRPGKHIQHPLVPLVMFGPWMLPLKIPPSCEKKSKPHDEAMGRCSSQQPHLNPALKLYQSRSQACEWFQPWEFDHPQLFEDPELRFQIHGVERKPLHCTLLKFLTHRICESDKIGIVLHSVLVQSIDN